MPFAVVEPQLRATSPSGIFHAESFAFLRGPLWEQDAFAKSYHIADGGYEDNYGIVSLLDWLDFRAKEAAKEAVPRIQRRGGLDQYFSTHAAVASATAH
jgi:hypothetical protein